MQNNNLMYILCELTFFLATFLIATRSPLNMPMVVNTWVGGNDVQLAMDARPEFTPNCCREKFCADDRDEGRAGEQCILGVYAYVYA